MNYHYLSLLLMITFFLPAYSAVLGDLFDPEEEQSTQMQENPDIVRPSIDIHEETISPYEQFWRKAQRFERKLRLFTQGDASTDKFTAFYRGPEASPEQLNWLRSEAKTLKQQAEELQQLLESAPENGANTERQNYLSDFLDLIQRQLDV